MMTQTKTIKDKNTPDKWGGETVKLVWRALDAIEFKTAKQLAEDIGIEHPLVSPALTDMRRKGWVEYSEKNLVARAKGFLRVGNNERLIHPQPDLLHRKKQPKQQAHTLTELIAEVHGLLSKIENIAGSQILANCPTDELLAEVARRTK